MKIAYKYMPKDEKSSERWYVTIDGHTRSIKQISLMTGLHQKEVKENLKALGAVIHESSQIAVFYNRDNVQTVIDWLHSLLIMNKLISGTAEQGMWKK